MSSSTLEELKNFVEAGHREILVEFSPYDDKSKFFVWIAELVRGMPEKNVRFVSNDPSAYQILSEHGASFHLPESHGVGDFLESSIDLMIGFEDSLRDEPASKQRLTFKRDSRIGRDHMVVKIPEFMDDSELFVTK